METPIVAGVILWLVSRTQNPASAVSLPSEVTPGISSTGAYEFGSGGPSIEVIPTEPYPWLTTAPFECLSTPGTISPYWYCNKPADQIPFAE